MGDIWASLLPKIDTHYDFKGQKKAERWFQIIHILFAVLGFIWGYMVQRFSIAVYSVLAAFVVSAVLTLPPWPMFRRNPLKWQPKTVEPDATASKKKKK